MVSHILSRAIQGSINAARTQYSEPKAPDAEPLPAGPVKVLILTILLFSVVLVLFDYSATVVLTLASVETPIPGYAPLSGEDVEEGPSEASDSEDALSQSDSVSKAKDDRAPLIPNSKGFPPNYRPITTGFVKTIRYLEQRTGTKASAFRGFRCAAFTGTIFLLISNVVNWALYGLSSDGWSPSKLLAVIIATVAVSPFTLTGTHIIISEPSPKNFFERARELPARTVLKMSQMYVVYLLISILVNILPLLVLKLFIDPNRGEEPLSPKEIGAIPLACLLYVAMFLLVQLPAIITMTRMEAALLPEGYEFIVPTGIRREWMGPVTAWKTFDWKARRKVLVLLSRMAWFFMAFTLVFALAIGGELIWVFGNRGEKLYVKLDTILRLDTW